MKKLSVILVFLLFAFAQQSIAQSITGKGVKLGLNLANHYGDDADQIDLKSKTGFCLGGFLTLGLGHGFALQPELLYTTKGAKAEEAVEEDGFDFGTIELAYDLAYLEIPVLFKYEFATDGSFKPNLFAGPAFGFLLSGEAEMSMLGMSVGIDLKENDAVKSTDFGLVFGGGFNIAAGSGSLLFDVRYDMGLTEIYQEAESEDMTLEAVKLKNGVLSFVVGYAF